MPWASVMRRGRIKHHQSYAAAVAAVCASLLLLCAGAEAKLVPVEPPAAAQSASPSPATAAPETSKPAAPATAPAATPDDDRLPFMRGPERGAEPAPPSAVGMLARTFGALLLVIGLLIGGTWCLRRIKGSPFAAGRDDARLTVIKTISIGERRSLTLVRFGERTLLLGSTQQSVTLLASDDDEDLSNWSASGPAFRSVADVLAAGDDEPAAQPVSFANEMDRVNEWREVVEGGRRDHDDPSSKWR